MTNEEEKKILRTVVVNTFNSFRLLPEEEKVKINTKVIDPLIEIIDAEINERKKRNEDKVGGIIQR